MGKGTAAIKAGGDIISAGLQMGGQIAMAEAMKYQADSDRNVARTRYLADRTTATADIKRTKEDRLANWETLEGKREEDATYAQEERDKAEYENKLFLRDLIYKEYLEERKRERELEDKQREEQMRQMEILQKQHDEERQRQEEYKAYMMYQKYGHLFGDIERMMGGGPPRRQAPREPYDNYGAFSRDMPPRMRGYDSGPDRSYRQSSNYDTPGTSDRYSPRERDYPGERDYPRERDYPGERDYTRPKQTSYTPRRFEPYSRREFGEIRQDNLEEASIQRQKFMNLEQYGSVIPAAAYRAQQVNKNKTKVGVPVRTKTL